MTREEFGQRLKAAREAARLTQAEVARKLSISQPNIAEYEAGRRIPSVTKLIGMVETLGLDPRLLFPEFFRQGRKRQ